MLNIPYICISAKVYQDKSVCSNILCFHRGYERVQTPSLSWQVIRACSSYPDLIFFEKFWPLWWPFWHECAVLIIVKTNDICVVAVVSCAPYSPICILLTKTLYPWLQTPTRITSLWAPPSNIFLLKFKASLSLSPLLSSCCCLHSIEIEKLLWCEVTSKWEFVLHKWQT